MCTAAICCLSIMFGSTLVSAATSHYPFLTGR